MRIKMSIEEFITKRSHNGRRGSPKISAGTTLFAIKYENGGYFPYSYEDRKDALNCIEMMKHQGTDTDKYKEWNVVWDIENTMHVSSKKVLVN